MSKVNENRFSSSSLVLRENYNTDTVSRYDTHSHEVKIYIRNLEVI